MRIQDILRTIQDNFYLAFILIALLAMFLGIGYLVIYKKLLKGEKTLSKGKTFIWFLLIGYIIMVIGVTFLNRRSGLFGDTNLHFLSSHRQAWNSFNKTTWRFIILNIFMLVPLGMLLPLLDSRFHQFKCTFGAAILFTLTIETMQLITGYGIFELDDIFNNVAGAIIGYGIIMAILTLINGDRGKYKKVIIYLLPLTTIIVISIGVLGVYNAKEFGNLYIVHSYKINMKKIEPNLNTEINDDLEYDVEKVPVYKAKSYDENSGEAFFKSFIEHKNSQEEIEVDPYNDTVIFWSRGEPAYNMWLEYNDGSYSYSDFSHLDEGIEKADADEETVLKELEKFNIHIPESAVFNKETHDNEVDRFEWSVDKDIHEDYMTDGKLSCEYYNDQSIKKITNNIVTYKKVKDIPIKTKDEAYKEIEKGRFNLHNSNHVEKINIEEIKLSYLLDSKGFYQPVYKFKVKIDGENGEILIPAI